MRNEGRAPKRRNSKEAKMAALGLAAAAGMSSPEAVSAQGQSVEQPQTEEIVQVKHMEGKSSESESTFSIERKSHQGGELVTIAVQADTQHRETMALGDGVDIPVSLSNDPDGAFTMTFFVDGSGNPYAGNARQGVDDFTPYIEGYGSAEHLPMAGPQYIDEVLKITENPKLDDTDANYAKTRAQLVHLRAELQRNVEGVQ